MAKAAKSRSEDPWPAEGLPLADAAARLLPDSWKRCSAELTTPLAQEQRDWDLSAPKDKFSAFNEEFRKLLLERSDLILTGRPKEPWADPVNISASVRFLADFSWESSQAYSLNYDLIYDVRVHRKLADEKQAITLIDSAETFPSSRRGGQVKFDWDRVVAEVIRRVHEEGVPTVSNVVLADDLIDWCTKQDIAPEKIPASDTIQRKLRKWLSPVRRGK